MVYIMTNSPDDTTATQQQRPQASQLPIDPVKIKAMIDYYIVEYREQLLDRDLLEQAIADDELFWRSSVWRVITSLIHIMRFSIAIPTLIIILIDRPLPSVDASQPISCATYRRSARVFLILPQSSPRLSRMSGSF